MGETVAHLRPDLHRYACELTGTDPFERAGEASRFAQPAIFATCIAHWSAWDGSAPVAVAGHSLGEIAALVAAGVMDELAALELVTTRGALMDAASADGAMVALMGRRAGDVADAIATATSTHVANRNSPGQVVLAGASAAIESASELATEQRLIAQRLDTSGAYHSPMMAGARPEFEAALAGMKLAAPRIPVYSSTTARPFTDVRAELSAALTSTVQWEATVRALTSSGITTFLEIGPGRTLTGLGRRIAPEANGIAVESLVAA